MNKAKKDIVLACHVYIDDGWYGDRRRVILSKEDGTGFTSKTEANKFKVRLRKHTTQMFNNQSKVGEITNENVVANEREEFKTYTYVSAGPSLSYIHYNITTADLS